MCEIRRMIGNALKHRRRFLKMNTRQVAEHMGVKHNTISRWETGRSNVSHDKLDKLCKLYKTSLATLQQNAKHICEEEGC